MILYTKLIIHEHVYEPELWITQYFQIAHQTPFAVGLNTKQMYKHKTNY